MNNLILNSSPSSSSEFIENEAIQFERNRDENGELNMRMAINEWLFLYHIHLLYIQYKDHHHGYENANVF